MALTSDQLDRCSRDLLHFQGDAAPFNIAKADLRAALAAAEQWATDNAVSYNAALPVAFRTQASASLKAALLAFVALRRAGQ